MCFQASALIFFFINKPYKWVVPLIWNCRHNITLALKVNIAAYFNNQSINYFKSINTTQMWCLLVSHAINYQVRNKPFNFIQYIVLFHICSSFKLRAITLCSSTEWTVGHNYIATLSAQYVADVLIYTAPSLNRSLVSDKPPATDTNHKLAGTNCGHCDFNLRTGARSSAGLCCLLSSSVTSVGCQWSLAFMVHRN